jgi:hypothetical protein
MKRALSAASVLFLCSWLVGCGSDSHNELINASLNLLDSAASEIGVVKTKVKEAIKAYDEGKDKTPPTPFDLKEAEKVLVNLKQTGEQAQRIKQRIDYVLSATPIREEDRSESSKKYGDKVNDIYKRLRVEGRDLNEVLQQAEAIDKDKTDDLRKKMVEALGPFESLGRQN